MTASDVIEVIEVRTGAQRRRFIDIQFALNRDDPTWVPPLKSDVADLISPGRNPWFEHATAALFIATRNGRDVGRISAQVDRLWLRLPAERGGGPECGNWGLFEAQDGAVATALIGRAREWLLSRGMSRMVGPLSLSIWDEPGLLVKGFERSPTVMMGHHDPRYASWIESTGQEKLRDLCTFECDITEAFSSAVQRTVEAGERNPRILIRKADKSRFDQEAALILSIVNDAWSGNWGIVPFTDAEINHAGRKLRPAIFESLVRIVEYDGTPVAFMLALPDVNEILGELGGALYPFGIVKLAWWLRGGLKGAPKVSRMRVALMGVRQALQTSFLASQMALMMVEHIRRDALTLFGASRAEFGWVDEGNLGMISLARAVEGSLTRIYRVYGQSLRP